MSSYGYGPGDRSQLVYAATMISVGFFVLATVAAMLLYPGGTYRAPEAGSYDFFRNTFSELGHTVDYRGEPKWASFLLFVLATTFAGVAMCAFFVVESMEAQHHGASRVLSRTAAVLGVGTGLAFVAIGAVPANRAFRIHFLFVYIAFTLFAPAVACMLQAWRRVPSAPGRRVRVGLYTGFLLLLTGYLVLIWFGPPLYREGGRVIQATGQKVIVYAAVATVGVISAAARGANRTFESSVVLTE